jgi:hypothetical protein
MQLRVARLCLDCEELHVENRCPRCISEHHAFLTTWLPSEERRQRRRLATATSSAHEGTVRSFANTLFRWVRGQPAPLETIGPATRQSDLVAHMDFDGRKASSRKEHEIETTERRTSSIARQV